MRILSLDHGTVCIGVAEMDESLVSSTSLPPLRPVIASVLMQDATLEYAETHLREIVDSVAKGESVVITKNGQPAARVVPVRGLRLRPVFGSAAGQVTIAPDFDAPLADFTPYQ